MSWVRSVRGAVAIGICSVLTLVACGGSSSEPKTAPAGAGQAGGNNVSAKIMLAGDFTSTIPYTVPEAIPIVKGALRGFPNVRIETCDTKGTPAASLTCVQKAVSGHVAAVINGYGQILTNEKLLDKAGIPLLGTTDTTTPISFAGVSTDAQFAGIGVSLSDAGCTKMGTVYYDGTNVLADLIKKGMESKGGTEVARAAVPSNSIDLAPAIGKLTRAGAECVAVSLAPSAAAQALTAIKQSGRQLKVASVSAVFSQALLSSLGPDLTNGLIVVDQQINPGDDSPGIAAIKADIASQNSKAAVTQSGITAWVAAKLLAAALPAVKGPVDAKSLLAALNGLRDVDLQGVVHPWSSVELKSTAYRRLFNHYGVTYTINNLKPTRSGDFFDLAGSTVLR